ncbi:MULTISPECIES: hypothetical protein [Micrococcales]|uniref:hypothetical protein n=1 Tax=Micrococcales TaxID=85006 RepID=UPI0021A8E3BA|nr:hypothetical protein [Microbacterium paraoxydans]MCT2224656.1 hypothetical protein [Microbacterium paraoxydans]
MTNDDRDNLARRQGAVLAEYARRQRIRRLLITIAVLIGVAIVVVAVALIAPMFTGPFDPSCGPPLGCR